MIAKNIEFFAGFYSLKIRVILYIYYYNTRERCKLLFSIPIKN